MTDSPLNGWKYLLVSDATGAEVDFPVVFPAGTEHKWMAERFAGRTILGAGFLRFGYEADGQIYKIETYGESESLGIKSQPGDADYLSV